MENSSGITKIFVGGLPQNCNEQGLADHFGHYGKILDSVVMKDRDTGNSRGFGFVTFESPGSVESALSMTDHWIDKKWVEVKLAIAKNDMPPSPDGYSSKGKGKGKIGGRLDSARGNSNFNFRSARDGTGKGGATPGQQRPGDWSCPNCSAHVFANKDECYKCHTRKRLQSSSSTATTGAGLVVGHNSSTVSSLQNGGSGQKSPSGQTSNIVSLAGGIGLTTETVNNTNAASNDGSGNNKNNVEANSSENNNASSNNPNNTDNSNSNSNNNANTNANMNTNFSSFPGNNGAMAIAMPGGCMPAMQQMSFAYPAQCQMGCQGYFYNGFGGCGMAMAGNGCYGYDQNAFAPQQQQQQQQQQLQQPPVNQMQQQSMPGYSNYPGDFSGCMVYQQQTVVR